mgnify:CR=1 FL=1
MDVASEAARDPNRASSQRVIPKWESIKDLPGVMYCENMKEILERNVRAGNAVDGAVRLSVLQILRGFGVLRQPILVLGAVSV